MANKKTIRIPIKVDGKEILLTQKQIKKLANDTNKAAGSFDAMNTSQRGADRAGKGLSRQSSNSTKNFSKMQQGISGGLVPAYATLAAQVFALSAAFTFLQSSSDFKNLLAGQKAYAGITGNMYAEVARSIRSATAAQISYTEASQAAAIGTAAGLSADQMTRLGEAAKNTSLALGRDVTDSFNRLIRGVTKAEPELLDELGIILRLDPALKEYATSIGKAKDALNAYERSQAVANFVLDQADKKFGAITDTMPAGAFALNQFAQAFNDLIDKLKHGLGTVAQTILPFFTKNVNSLAAALVLFSLPILKSILPNFGQLSATLATSAIAHKTAFTSMKADIIDYEMQTAVLRNDPTARAKFQKQGTKGVKSIAMEAGYKPAKGGEFSNQQLGQIKRHLRNRTGLFAKHGAERVAIGQAALRKLDIAEAAHTGKTMTVFGNMGRWLKLQWLRLQRRWKGTMSFMAKAAGYAATAINIAFMAIAAIGIVTMLYDMVFGFEEADDAASKLKQRMDDIGESTQRQNESLMNMIKMQKDGLVEIAQRAYVAANAIKTLGMEQQFKEVDEIFTDSFYGKVTMAEFGEEGAVDAAKKKGALFQSLADLQDAPGLKAATQAIATSLLKARRPSEDMIARFRKLSGEYVGTAMSAEQLSESMKSINANMTNFIGSGGGKYTNFIQNLDTGIKQQEASIKLLQETIDAQKGEGDYEKQGFFDLFHGPVPGTLKPGVENRNEQQANLAFLKDQRKVINELQIADTNRLASLASVNKRLADQEKTYGAIDKVNALPLVKERNNLAITEAKNKQTAAKAIYDAALLRLGAENALTIIAKAQMELSGTQLESIKAITKEKNDQADIDAERVMFAERVTKALQFEAQLRKNINNLKGQGYQINTMFGGTDIGNRAAQINTNSARAASVQTSLDIVKGKRANLQMLGEDGTNFSLRMQKLDLEKKELQLLKQKVELEGTYRDMLLTSFNKAAGKLSGDVASGAIGVLKGEKTGKEAMKEIAESFAETMISELIKQFVANILAQLLSSFLVQGTQTIMNTSAIAANTLAVTANTAASYASGFFRYGGTVPGYRNGGIISAAEGTVANGPQAGYPAVLHGKEAVVPLGEKNSIPVEFKGGSPSGVTNSVVNVTVNSDGSTQMDDKAASELGRSIQSAVTNEISRQQRSGGLLAGPRG